MIVVSGMRPTGRLHIGHLEGVIRNWLALQEKARCYFFVADLHALTDHRDPAGLAESAREMLLDWLALGIDPERAVVFVQSRVSAHAELAALLGMVTPVSWLERCPTYKDRLGELDADAGAGFGLLGYPVLMTADVALYRADSIPVGEDQVAHLEISREIVRRMNALYRTDLVEPKPLLTAVPKLTGTDGRKMSKSYGNTIEISLGPDEIRRKVKEMITDPARVRRTDPGNPDVCRLFPYHLLYTRPREAEIRAGCTSAALGCVECKGFLVESLCAALEGYWEKRRSWAAAPGRLRDAAEAGARRAAAAAAPTLEAVRSAMGLRPLDA